MLMSVGLFPRKIGNLHSGTRNKQKIHTKWRFQSPERVLPCKLHLCSSTEMGSGLHTLGVLCRDCQHLPLCLFCQVLKVSLDKDFHVSSPSPQSPMHPFNSESLRTEFSDLILFSITKEVFHCPVSCNNVLYHMITTFKSLLLTAIRKNNVTSRIQIAFRYVLGILQLVNSFYFHWFIPEMCRDPAVICYLHKLVVEM